MLTSKFFLHLWRSLEITLTLFPIILLFIASLQFIFGSTITNLTLPASLLLVLILGSLWNIKNNQFKVILPLILITLGLITLSYFFSKLFLDFSYDGQAYHMPTTILLAHGWNPFYYPDLFSYLKKIPNIFPPYIFTNDDWLVWSIHHTKAFELMNAAAMLFCKQKLINPSIYIGVFISSLFLTCYRVLGHFSLEKAIRVLLTIVITLNPILDVQFSSACVDGLLAYTITIIIFSLIDYIQGKDKISLIIASLATALLINVKFTGLIYAIVLGIGFGIYLLKNSSMKNRIIDQSENVLSNPNHPKYVNKIRFKINKLKKKELKNYFLHIGIAIMLGVGMLGYQPYVTNALRHNYNIFYPVIIVNNSKIKMDNAIEGMLPQSFMQKNRFEKFFISIFAKRLNENDSQPILQFPYTGGINTANARYGGFGPIFGLEFCLALIFLFFVRNKLLLYTSILLIVSAFVLDSAWWARYIPQLWLVPIFVAIDFLRNNNPINKKIIGALIIFLACINIENMYWGLYYLDPPNEIQHILHKDIPNNIAYIFPAPRRMAKNNPGSILFTWAALERYGIKTKFTSIITCRKPFRAKISNPAVKICD